jgi:hypothetical protein
MDKFTNKLLGRLGIFNPLGMALMCQLQVVTAAIIGGVLSAGAGMYSANKAKQAAADAAKSSQVDINNLDQIARRIALQNAQESAALEQSMTPEVPELRKRANQGVIDSLGTSNEDGYMQGLLSRSAESNVTNGRSPLLQAAIAKAKADLAKGGKLSGDTQNAVTRQGLATAGTVGGGLGLGRDVVARDLGLTSLGLEDQRLKMASQLGGQELALNQYDTGTEFNNRANTMNAVSLMQQLQGNKFNRNLAAAQYGQSIRPPVVGLDPSSVVNLTVGNSNAAGAAQANQADIYGQQGKNWMNLAGQMGGAALMKYNSTPKPANNGPDNGLYYV